MRVKTLYEEKHSITDKQVLRIAVDFSDTTKFKKKLDPTLIIEIFENDIRFHAHNSILIKHLFKDDRTVQLKIKEAYQENQIDNDDDYEPFPF